MSVVGGGVISSVEQLTPARLTRILRECEAIRAAQVVEIKSSPIGDGLLCDSMRLVVTYDREEEGAPSSLAGKFPSKDPEARTNSQAMGVYRREVEFYRDISPTVAVRAPRAYYAEVAEAGDEFGLIMEDLSCSRRIDQTQGVGREDALLVMDQAAALHGPRWNDPALLENPMLADMAPHRTLVQAFPVVLQTFVQRFGPHLEANHLDTCMALASRIADFVLYKPKSITAVHVDFRLDNMLFDAAGGTVPLAILDWQSIRAFSGAQDLAYFLAFNVPPQVRRDNEADLLERYHERLLEHGAKCDRNEFFREYRIQAHAAVAMAIMASGVAKRNDHADRMFLAMARGGCAMMADLETLKAI